MTHNTASVSLSCLSTFTGAGGLDLGLEAAGFDVVGCVEADDSCRTTLAANRPGWRQLGPQDVIAFAKKLKGGRRPDELNDVDLLAGGPPCQPYSKAAQWRPSGRAGLDDPRAAALDGFLDLIDIFTPRAVLIENVSGFAKGRSSSVGHIREALATINKRQGTRYELDFEVLDAADYGVPQKRERALLVAFREGVDGWQWPVTTHAAQPTTAWDALHDIVLNDVPVPQGKWAALLPSIPEGQNYIWHTNRGGGQRLFGYRTRFWSFLLKLAKTQPSWTVPASPGPSTGPFHWDNRPLAPIEVLRLQGFPADWELRGSLRAQLRQAGNATPPLLAEVVGRSVARHLNPQLNQTKSYRHAIPRAKDQPPSPEDVAPVPAKYRELVGVHNDHPGPGKGPSPVSMD